MTSSSPFANLSTSPSSRGESPDIEDRLSSVQRTLDSSVETMKENVSLMTERGEQMQTLLDKSETLGETSEEFQTRARHLERSMWWQKWRIGLLAAMMCLLILVILFFVNRFVFWLSLVVVSCVGVLGVYVYTKSESGGFIEDSGGSLPMQTELFTRAIASPTFSNAV